MKDTSSANDAPHKSEDDIREAERRKWDAFRDVLGSWSSTELMDCLAPGDLVEAIIEQDVFSENEVTEILKRPENARFLNRHALSGELELIKLCGGAKTPAEERALYEAALRQGDVA